VDAIQVWGCKRVLSKTMSKRNIWQITILFYIFEASGLDLRIQLRPFKHLTPSSTYKSNVSIHSPRSVVESDIPLYWIGREGWPPNTAILVRCSSDMEVAKWAQVDAQLPLPTGNNQPRYALCEFIPAIERRNTLTDHYLTGRPNVGQRDCSKGEFAALTQGQMEQL
jgi:hypothetical protein